MRINADLFSFIDSKDLMEFLERNPELKAYVDEETGRRAKEEKACGCSGCGGCGKGCSSPDAEYLTTALSAILDYYIPDNVKNALHLSNIVYIDGCPENK